MINLIKKIILGRYHNDNFKVYSEVSTPYTLNSKLHICIKYKTSLYPDIRFTWNINSNQVTVTNRQVGYVPLSVIDMALDYLYGYFFNNKELLPTLLVSPYDIVMMDMLTIRGTQLIKEDDALRSFVLHGSSVDTDRFSEIYSILPAIHIPSRILKLYAVTLDPVENHTLPIKSHHSVGLRGVMLFPKPELAVLDFVANQSKDGGADVHVVYLYEVNIRDAKSLICPFKLLKKQALYDAHVTRAHLNSSDVPCRHLSKLIVSDDGDNDLMIRAYDNTITVKHSNSPITIIGL